MPDVKITVGELYATFFYRIVLPDGHTLVVASSPLTPEVAGRIIGVWTEEYSLIVPLEPAGYPWAFLRGFTPAVAYVQQQMQLPPWACSLLARIMVPLAAAAPLDDIYLKAQAWYQLPTGGRP